MYLLVQKLYKQLQNLFKSLPTSTAMLPASWLEASLFVSLGMLAWSGQPPVAVVALFAWTANFLYGKRRWQIWSLDVACVLAAALVYAPGVVQSQLSSFRILVAGLSSLAWLLNALIPLVNLPPTTGPFQVASVSLFLQRNGLDFRVQLLHPAVLTKLAQPAP